MDTHGFQDHVKVQRFCLTPTGEARLWYESLIAINIDWSGLQNVFRQQYSKIGNTGEQLFHAWRSFHFDKKCRNDGCLCTSHKTGCHTFSLSRTTNIILGSFPNNGAETSSRIGKKNVDKGKDRQITSRTDFLNSIHEHKRRVW